MITCTPSTVAEVMAYIGTFFLDDKNSTFIYVRLYMIFVTVVRKKCLAVILCPGPLK